MRYLYASPVYCQGALKLRKEKRKNKPAEASKSVSQSDLQEEVPTGEDYLQIIFACMKLGMSLDGF